MYEPVDIYMGSLQSYSGRLLNKKIIKIEQINKRKSYPPTNVWLYNRDLLCQNLTHRWLAQ